MLNPWGLTVPLSLAEWLVTKVAGFVMTTGRRVEVAGEIALE